jgi:hypothetical protein
VIKRKLVYGVGARGDCGLVSGCWDVADVRLWLWGNLCFDTTLRPGLESLAALGIYWDISAFGALCLQRRLVQGFLEIIRIPAIDYILVFVLAGIFWLIIKIMRFLRTAPARKHWRIECFAECIIII